jgi:hypothetical protein
VRSGSIRTGFTVGPPSLLISDTAYLEPPLNRGVQHHHHDHSNNQNHLSAMYRPALGVMNRRSDYITPPTVASCLFSCCGSGGAATE